MPKQPATTDDPFAQFLAKDRADTNATPGSVSDSGDEDPFAQFLKNDRKQSQPAQPHFSSPPGFDERHPMLSKISDYFSGMGIDPGIFGIGAGPKVIGAAVGAANKALAPSPESMKNPMTPEQRTAHPTIAKVADEISDYDIAASRHPLEGPAGALMPTLHEASKLGNAAIDASTPEIPESTKEAYPKLSAAAEAGASMSKDFNKRLLLLKDPLAGTSEAAQGVVDYGDPYLNKMGGPQGVKKTVQAIEGLGLGAADTAEALGTRENAALAGGMGALKTGSVASRLISAGFTKEMVQAAGKDIGEGIAAYQQGDTRTAARKLSGGVVTSVLAVLTGSHAVHGDMTAAPKAEVESNRITPDETPQATAEAPAQPQREAANEPAIPEEDRALLESKPALGKQISAKPRLQEGDEVPAAMLADNRTAGAIHNDLQKRGLAVDDNGRVVRSESDLEMMRAGNEAQQENTQPQAETPAQAAERRSSEGDVFRKQVEEMSPQEKDAAITQLRSLAAANPITGAPGKVAYDLAERESPSAVKGASDVNGLTAFNEHYGHDGGTELLKAKTSALRRAGVDFYHIHGDEFVYRGDSGPELQQKLEKANAILKDSPIRVVTPDGEVKYYKGATFSYGIGKDLREADIGAKLDKAARRERGDIGPKGSLTGFSEVSGAERNSTGSEGGNVPGTAGRPEEPSQGNGGGVPRGRPGVQSGEVKPQKNSTEKGEDDSSLFSLHAGIPLHKVGEIYDKLIGKPLARAVSGKDITKRPDVEKIDRPLAELLMQGDNMRSWVKAKSAEMIKKVVADLSPEQERLATLMMDATARENLRAKHPEEYKQALTDSKVMAAVHRYRPYEQELTQATKQLGVQVIDKDYLKRSYPEHAGPGKEQAFTAMSRMITPQKASKFSREANAEYHYENGLHQFAPSFAPKFEATMVGLLKNRIVAEFGTKATQIDFEKGDSMPPQINYGGQAFYRGDVARKMRENGEKVGKDQEYAVYDPTAGKKFETSDVRLLGPKSIVKALNGIDAGEIGQLGPIHRFFQQQIVSFGLGVPHVMNIMRRVSFEVGLHPVADPRAWVAMWKVAVSKEMRNRGMAGLEDQTADMLARHGAMSVGEAQNIKQYIGGNLNPVNWMNLLAKPGHALLFKPGSWWGFGGLDQRARIFIADGIKSRNPNWTDAHISDAVNQALGDYNKANWSERQIALGRFMLFPGWDFSSARYVLQHPIKTFIAPAFVVWTMNRALHHLGYNKEQDQNDMNTVHIGDRSFTSPLLTESMGKKLGAPVIAGIQAKLEGKSDSRALHDVVGKWRAPGEAAADLVNPLISAPFEVALNKELHRGDIVKPNDTLRPGTVLPNKAMEDVALFALRKVLPQTQRMFDFAGDFKPDWASVVGGNVGMSNYGTDNEKRIRSRAAAANEAMQTFSQLSKTDPVKAEQLLKQDPDTVILAAFAPSVNESIKSFNEIQRGIDAVNTSRAPQAKKDAALKELQQLQEEELYNAGELDNAIQHVLQLGRDKLKPKER